MTENRGPYVGPQTKPRQLPRSRVTIEAIERDEVRVSGCYDVGILGAQWQQTTGVRRRAGAGNRGRDQERASAVRT
jgi:hypothetical protein